MLQMRHGRRNTETLSAEYGKLSEYKGHLGDSADTLLSYLKLRDELYIKA